MEMWNSLLTEIVIQTNVLTVLETFPLQTSCLPSFIAPPTIGGGAYFIFPESLCYYGIQTSCWNLQHACSGCDLCIKAIHYWLDLNGLCLNPEKTEAVVFGSLKTTLTQSTLELSISRHLTVWRVWVSYVFTFSQHVDAGAVHVMTSDSVKSLSVVRVVVQSACQHWSCPYQDIWQCEESECRTCCRSISMSALELSIADVTTTTRSFSCDDTDRQTDRQMSITSSCLSVCLQFIVTFNSLLITHDFLSFARLNLLHMQVLDENYELGNIILPMSMILLQYCPSPQRYASDYQPPNYTVWLLEPTVRHCWLLALLVVLYKVCTISTLTATVIQNQWKGHPRKFSTPRNFVAIWHVSWTSTRLLNLVTIASEGTFSWQMWNITLLWRFLSCRDWLVVWMDFCGSWLKCAWCKGCFVGFQWLNSDFMSKIPWSVYR